VLGDLHDWFYGHGFNNPPNWYAGDCTHPNTFGHDQIRRRFYTLITGETLPEPRSATARESVALR
jgi:hypothetical protein